MITISIIFITLNIVKPKLKFFSEIDLDPDLLVVHIRNMEGHPDCTKSTKLLYEII